MAATLTLVEKTVHIPEAKWTEAMNCCRAKLGEPETVVPAGAPLTEATEVEWGALHFVRGMQAFATRIGLNIFGVGAGGGSLPSAHTIALTSVAEPGRFVNNMDGEPEPEDGEQTNNGTDAGNSDDADNQTTAARRQAPDTSPEELTDEAFEKSTAGQVVQGVIHNPNF